jgi:hypothetical protein
MSKSLTDAERLDSRMIALKWPSNALLTTSRKRVAKLERSVAAKKSGHDDHRLSLCRALTSVATSAAFRT